MIFLVTGCSRGLGLEFVRQLLTRGERVIATCRSPAEATELSALVAAAEPSGSTLLALDVSEEASIAKFPALLDEASIAAIDVLVHNAGVSAPTHPVDPVATATGSALRRCFEVNAVGPLLLTQALLPRLRAGRGRKVLVVSSIMGSIQNTKAGGSVSYRTSKAAVNMIGKCLAGEHGIGTDDELAITLCHPGWCDTDSALVHIEPSEPSPCRYHRRHCLSRCVVCSGLRRQPQPACQARGLRRRHAGRDRRDGGSLKSRLCGLHRNSSRVVS